MPMAYEARGQLYGEEARLEFSGSEKYDVTPMNIQEKQRFCYLDVSKLYVFSPVVFNLPIVFQVTERKFGDFYFLLHHTVLKIRFVFYNAYQENKVDYESKCSKSPKLQILENK